MDRASSGRIGASLSDNYFWRGRRSDSRDRRGSDGSGSNRSWRLRSRRRDRNAGCRRSVRFADFLCAGNSCSHNDRASTRDWLGNSAGTRGVGGCVNRAGRGGVGGCLCDDAFRGNHCGANMCSDTWDSDRRNTSDDTRSSDDSDTRKSNTRDSRSTAGTGSTRSGRRLVALLNNTSQSRAARQEREKEGCPHCE